MPKPKHRYAPDYELIILILMVVFTTVLIMSYNGGGETVNNQYVINYTYNYDYEEAYVWNLLDFADVLLQNVTVNSVDEAINYARQYDGLCRHYSTILYILLHNHLNRPVFLVSGMGMQTNCSDIYVWDETIESNGFIQPTHVSNHMWVYDPEYGEIDLMREKNPNCSTMNIPIFTYALYDKWGYKTYNNVNNTKALYDYYLGIFEKNNLPEINKSQIKFQTTKQWLSDKGYGA